MESSGSVKKSLGKSAGQIAGVQRMIEEERYCVNVLNQISAVRSALQKKKTKYAHAFPTDA